MTNNSPYADRAIIPADFAPNELGFLWEKFTRLGKARKIKITLVYFFSLIYQSLPGAMLPLLELGTVPHSSLMDQRILENYFLYYPSQDKVALGSVNPVLLKSIICMEDGNYFIHKGVDWDQLRISIRQNERRKKPSRGGSTISMQLSKNLFYTTSRSFFRKAKEILTTFRMEKEVSKEAILNQYVNIIEWGDGIFGIGKASDYYFHKTPSELTAGECSRLAAVIPGPLRYKPTEARPYVLHRSAIIRGRYNSVSLGF